MQHYLDVQEGRLVLLLRNLQEVRARLILGQLAPEVLQDHPPVLLGLEIPVIPVIQLLLCVHALL